LRPLHFFFFPHTFAYSSSLEIYEKETYSPLRPSCLVNDPTSPLSLSSSAFLSVLISIPTRPHFSPEFRSLFFWPSRPLLTRIDEKRFGSAVRNFSSPPPPQIREKDCKVIAVFLEAGRNSPNPPALKTRFWLFPPASSPVLPTSFYSRTRCRPRCTHLKRLSDFWSGFFFFSRFSSHSLPSHFYLSEARQGRSGAVTPIRHSPDSIMRKARDPFLCVFFLPMAEPFFPPAIHQGRQAPCGFSSLFYSSLPRFFALVIRRQFNLLFVAL